MKTILEVDVGNSRMKWRLWKGGVLHDRGSLPSGAVSELPDADEVRWLSVNHAASIDDYLVGRVSRPSIFVGVSGVSRAGVTNAYAADPGRLGVDRWAALLGAFRRYGGGCAVIDIGTASTVDYLASDGVHLGGFIAPGPDLLEQALRTGTRGVKYESTMQGRSSDPGRNTADCVERGVRLMLVGFISRAIDLGASRGCPKVIATGGGFDMVREEFPSVVVDPDLVLDGLSIMAEDGQCD